MENKKGGYYRGNKFVEFTWGDKISEGLKNKKGDRNIKLICKVCGKEFKGYVKHQRYCSKECRQKAPCKYKNIEDPIVKRAVALSSCVNFGKGRKEFFINLVRQNIGKHCKYCEGMLTLENMSLDHIIPFGKSSLRTNKLVKKQLDKPENLQIICRKCNLMKGDLSHEKFVKLLDFLNGDLQLRDYIFKKLGQSNLMWSFKRKSG